jgi:hypothetical protein
MRPIIQNGGFNVLVGIQVEKLWITRVWSCLASYRLNAERPIGLELIDVLEASHQHYCVSKYTVSLTVMSRVLAAHLIL